MVLRVKMSQCATWRTGFVWLALNVLLASAAPSPLAPTISTINEMDEVVTLCPRASAIVFTGPPLNSTAPGRLELAAKPGTCLVAIGGRSDPCEGHGCISEAPCPTAANPCPGRGLCEWMTAPPSGGDGALVQVIDARGHPVCFDFNEDLKRVQAFDCETTTGHLNRSAFQHWELVANETANDFTIQTTMKNHSSSANVCSRKLHRSVDLSRHFVDKGDNTTCPWETANIPCKTDTDCTAWLTGHDCGNISSCGPLSEWCQWCKGNGFCHVKPPSLHGGGKNGPICGCY